MNKPPLVLSEAVREASLMGYKLKVINPSSYVVILKKEGVQVNIYWKKNFTGNYTVSTSMNHPKKGKTQLHRKNISQKQLIDILKNPRKHTGKGYYKKSNK